MDTPTGAVKKMEEFLTKEEREGFTMCFKNFILEDLIRSKDFIDMESTKERLVSILEYNVPHGKRTRGITTVIAYKAFAAETHGYDKERIKQSFVLGWCVEILQAFGLLVDDVMDQSPTRRHRSCWFSLPSVGSSALNDGLLLEQFVYYVLRRYFGRTKIYPKLVELFQEVSRLTVCGQSLDLQMGREKCYEEYTDEKYSTIVKYKTTYYTFHLPVLLGMVLAEVENEKLVKSSEAVLVAIGHCFQVQDDFIDCYGEAEQTGKQGTDIQDGKCTWLLVNALKMANVEQRKMLLDNVGKTDQKNVDIVKGIYTTLKLPALFSTFEKEQFAVISQQIEELESSYATKLLLFAILRKIHRRKA